MKTRLYAVRAIIGGSEKNYLVDAASKQSAKHHVADKHIEAEIASGKDVAALMAKGVVPESAVDESGGKQETLPA